MSVPPNGNPTSPLTPNKIAGEVADLLVGVYQGQKPAIEAFIAGNEAKIAPALAKMLADLPRPKGIFGDIEGQIETTIGQQLVVYVTALLQQYGADAVYNIIDLYLETQAKNLGG